MCHHVMVSSFANAAARASSKSLSSDSGPKYGSAGALLARITRRPAADKSRALVPFQRFVLQPPQKGVPHAIPPLPLRPAETMPPDTLTITSWPRRLCITAPRFRRHPMSQRVQVRVKCSAHASLRVQLVERRVCDSESFLVGDIQVCHNWSADRTWRGNKIGCVTIHRLRYATDSFPMPCRSTYCMRGHRGATR